MSDQDLSTCRIFAENIDIENYQKRNQYNEENVRYQHFVGKVGEFLVRRKLDRYITLSDPDCEIYDKDRKTWDSDLRGGNICIQVKTIDWDRYSENKWEPSWVIQKQEIGSHYGMDKEIYDNTTDERKMIAFVWIRKYNGIQGKIKSLIPIPFLHKYNLLKDPFIKRMIGIKEAVYYKDLLSNGLIENIGDYAKEIQKS